MRAHTAALILVVTGFLAACASLVSAYDATFDTSLNTLSVDTAKFLAAAKTGGAERSYSSKEAVAYYAATDNLMQRLIQRARLTRGSVPCPTDESLIALSSATSSRTVLPDDYRKLDCREFQLYGVAFYVDQLHYAHETDGLLNASEAAAVGGIFQIAILGAIQTFAVNKPGI